MISRSSLKQLLGIVVFFAAVLSSALSSPAQVVRFSARDQDAVLRKFRHHGTARVIVDIAVQGYIPEGRMPPAAAARQRQTLAIAQTSVLARLSQRAATAVYRFAYTPQIAITVDEAALNALLSDPTVSAIHDNAELRPSLSQSVPLIGAATAHNWGYSGRGQTIAVIDTGVDTSHPFFSGKMVSEACYSDNTSSKFFPNSSQPNDYYFINRTSLCPHGLQVETGPDTGRHCTLVNGEAVESCKHGTLVAGVAVGSSASLSGVAKDATLIAIQVFHGVTSSAGTIQPPPGSCSTANWCIEATNENVIRGLQRVYDLRNAFSIAAANLSLSSPIFISGAGPCPGNAYSMTMDLLRSVDIATVVASGNAGSDTDLGFPACDPLAVSVGATTKNDAVWLDPVTGQGSNVATYLHLLAPGANIQSSVPGGGFDVRSGTSLSAPHVAGAWAVLKAKKPGATVHEILSELTQTGILVTDTRYSTSSVTKPRIQLHLAVSSLSLLAPSLGGFLSGPLQQLLLSD